jgi:hypothetical protein
VCDECIADGGAGAGFVVNDDLLTPDLGQLFSDDPRVNVRRPARRKRYNQVDGSIGPRICPAQANQARRDCRCST